MRVSTCVSYCYFLSAYNLCQSVFTNCTLAGEDDTPIGAMPGCYRLGWRHGLVQEVGELSAGFFTLYYGFAFLDQRFSILIP